MKQTYEANLKNENSVCFSRQNWYRGIIIQVILT